MEQPEYSHLNGFRDKKSWIWFVSDPSEKVHGSLRSERQNLANDWPKVLILPEVPSENFLLPLAGIKMQPNPLGN